MRPYQGPDAPPTKTLCSRYFDTFNHQTPPRKTAREKLNPPSKLPKQKPAPAIWGGGSMVLPHPLEIRKRMQAVSTYHTGRNTVEPHSKTPR